MLRRVSRPAAVLLAAVLGTGAAKCGGADGAGTAGGPSNGATVPAATPVTTSLGVQPQPLRGVPLAGPTRLLLLADGSLMDVDAGTYRRIAVTSWLDAAGRPRLLLAESESFPEFGHVQVIAAPTAADLPGRPRVVRLVVPGSAVLAASVDGDGVWAGEYHSRYECSLREIGLDGVDRRPSRTVPCGVRPVVETPAGLWVSEGPDDYIAAVKTTGNEDYAYLLLDPVILTERARYPEARIVDDYRVVTMDDAEREPVLRDLRTARLPRCDGLTTRVTPPSGR